MTGIAAIASRIDSIENRLEDFRTSTAEFGGTSGRAAVSADAMDANRSGAVFSGVLGSMTMGGTQTAGLFGYVTTGTKLATVPGTQAYEAAQLAAREAAAAEAAARASAARRASSNPPGRPALPAPPRTAPSPTRSSRARDSALISDPMLMRHPRPARCAGSCRSCGPCCSSSGSSRPRRRTARG